MKRKVMKYLLASLITSLSMIALPGQPSVIPVPVHLKLQTGNCNLNSSFIISINTGNQNSRLPELLSAAKIFTKQVSAATGFNISIKQDDTKALIYLRLLQKKDTLLGQEGYRLSVQPGKITLQANEPAGIFYGMQTLLQLLPPAIESVQQQKSVAWSVPAVEIIDYPRFGWRGLMLDVVRHFFTMQQVKQFVDDMVKYKYNVLHLHLSDDQGWRIEIKGLPELTETGAWNVAKTGADFGNFSAPADNEPRTAGGFYTQEQIAELIQYCRERYVNVLPEIDVPGHSMALVAAYPHLSGTPGTYRVNSGENFIRFTHPESEILEDNELMTDNTISPAKEEVYTFLDTVITQLAKLFPFGYLHMGGDECIKNFWKENAAIKALMQREGLKNLDAVQSYFVNRIEKIVASKGKRMIGWDEILQESHSSNAVIMSWRGMEGGIAAARKGQEVIMTPCNNVYLDFMQGDSAIESNVYGTLRLKTTYGFEPVPPGCNPALIKGGQGNLWTEKVYNTRHLQYMLWPRAFAIAEVLWSPVNARNWNDFSQRVEAQFLRFDKAEKKYAPSMYEPSIQVSRNDKGDLLVKLETEAAGVDMHYSFDNSFPDSFYPAYKEALVLPKDISVLRLMSYKNGRPAGRMISVSKQSLVQRAEASAKVASQQSSATAQ